MCTRKNKKGRKKRKKSQRESPPSRNFLPPDYRIKLNVVVSVRHRGISHRSRRVRTYGQHKREASPREPTFVWLLSAREGAATLLIALRLRRTSTYLRTYTQTAVKIKPSMRRRVDILLLWVADSAAAALTWNRKKRHNGISDEQIACSHIR